MKPIALQKRMQKMEERALLKKAQLGILPEPESNSCDSLVDALATIEHEQWMEWAKALLETEPGISKERTDRWKRFFCRYEDLPEEVKELDRKWAKRVLKVIQQRLA